MSSDEELPQFRLRSDDHGDPWAPDREGDAAPTRPTYQRPVEPRVVPPSDPVPAVGGGAGPGVVAPTGTPGPDVSVIEYEGDDVLDEVALDDGIRWKPIAAIVVVVVLVVAATSVIGGLIDDDDPFRQTRTYIADPRADRLLIDAGPAREPQQVWTSEAITRCATSSVRLLDDVLVLASRYTSFEYELLLRALDARTGEELWSVGLSETPATVYPVDRRAFLSVQSSVVSVRSLVNGAEIVGIERARSNGITVRGDRVVVMRTDETVIHDLMLNPLATLKRFGRGSFTGERAVYDVGGGVVAAYDIATGERLWSTEVVGGEQGVELDDAVVVRQRSNDAVGLDRETGEIIFDIAGVDRMSPLSRQTFTVHREGAAFDTQQVFDGSGSLLWEAEAASFLVAITNGPPVILASGGGVTVRDEFSGEVLAEHPTVDGAAANGLFVREPGNARTLRFHDLVDGDELWRIRTGPGVCTLEAVGDGLVVVGDEGIAFWR